MIQQNNRELFIRWYAWSLKFKDCDPAVWVTDYLNERYEHNTEQKLWFCWLYGNTYQLPTAWVLLNEFPDFELATPSRIEKWNSENYKRLRYQTDTKWNKGHLPSMFVSYKKFIGNGTQQEKFESLYGNNPKENFENIWDAIKTNLHKFGRYSTWFYMQHLKHTAGLLIEPTSMMFSDFAGSASHRNGFCLALGKPEWVDQKLSPTEIAGLEREAISVQEEVKTRYPDIAHLVDAFTMETALCAFKKIFRKRDGRYLGYYLDRQAEEILVAEKDGWSGIEWEVLWQARSECLDNRLVRKTGIQDHLFSLFLETGDIKYSEWLENKQSKSYTLEDFF
jgi:hypothetical protein